MQHWYCTCLVLHLFGTAPVGTARDVIWSIKHTMERLGELCFRRAILWYLSF
jgi:hypothetical protein